MRRQSRRFVGAAGLIALALGVTACVPTPNVPIAAPGVNTCGNVKTLVSDNAQYITTCSGLGPMHWDTTATQNAGRPIPALSQAAAMSGDGTTIFDISSTGKLIKISPFISPTPTVVSSSLPTGYWQLLPNKAGTRVVAKNLGSNDVPASLLVDLTSTVPTTTKLTAFLASDEVPFDASIDDTRLNILYYTTTNQVTPRWRSVDLVTRNVANGVVVNRSGLCEISLSSIIGSSTRCSNMQNLGVEYTVVNIRTGVVTFFTLDGVAHIIKADGSKMLQISGALVASGPTTSIPARSATAPITIDKNVFYIGFAAVSSSNTAVVYKRCSSPGDYISCPGQFFATSF